MEEEIKVKPKKSMKKVIIFGILIVIFCSAAIILILTHEELITHSIIEYGQEKEFQKALENEDNKSYHIVIYRTKYSNELKELNSGATFKDPHHLLKGIGVENYYVVDLRGTYYFELGDYVWFESDMPGTSSGWVRSVKKNYYEVVAVDSITEMTLEELKENGEYY